MEQKIRYKIKYYVIFCKYYYFYLHLNDDVNQITVAHWQSTSGIGLL